MTELKNQTKSKNEDEFILFSLTKKKIFVYILIATIFWVLSVIFYLLPDLEHDILIFFNDLRQPGNFFRDFWYFYTKWFVYIFGFFLLGIYFASFKIEKLKPYRTTFFISVVLYAIGSPLIDYIIKPIIGRPRPYLPGVFNDLYNIYDVKGCAFPSGHSYIAFSMVLPLFTALTTNDGYFRTSLKKYVASVLLLIYASAMSLSRIFVGVHYPSDVLFSVGLAVMFELFFVFIFKKLLSSGKYNNQNEKWYSITFDIIIIVITVLSF
ncbi:MAG: phosphatase PAP2 family protein [Promethearchaeota archaeon]